MQRTDLRPKWDESPEKRESVRRDLHEWGRSQRGGMPNLGYPSRDYALTDDTAKIARYDYDKIQAMNDAFVLWWMLVERCGDDKAKKTFKRELKAMKHYFIGGEPYELVGHKMKCSSATVCRLIDSGSFKFWVVSL